MKSTRRSRRCKERVRRGGGAGRGRERSSRREEEEDYEGGETAPPGLHPPTPAAAVQSLHCPVFLCWMQPEDKDGCVHPEQEVSWPLTPGDNVYVSGSTETVESLLKLLLITREAFSSFHDLNFPVSPFVLLLLLIVHPHLHTPHLQKVELFLPSFCFPFPQSGCALTVALWVKKGKKEKRYQMSPYGRTAGFTSGYKTSRTGALREVGGAQKQEL